MIVCRALLISAAIDSITSAIVSIVRYLPTSMCSCCATCATARISAIGRSVSMSSSTNARGARDTRFSVPTPRPLEMSGSTSADLKPALSRTLTSSRSASACAIVGDQQRLERAHHHADRRAVDLEDDVRTRPVAPLVLLDARGEGFELLAGLGQQRQPDAIAADQAGDPHRQRLERQADVDRPRDDLQHRILRLQLLDLVQRRAVGVLALGQPLAERADAPRRQHGENDGHDPAGDQPDRDDAGVERTGDRPEHELKGGNPSNQPPDQAQLRALIAPSVRFHGTFK